MSGYISAYKLLCDEWPGALLARHSFAIIQAAFGPIHGGESVDTRKQMLARAEEVLSISNSLHLNTGRPKPLSVHKLLRSTLPMQAACDAMVSKTAA